jgi:hypothetical protein
VFHDILNFLFQVVVVFLDEPQPVLLIDLQLFIYFKQPSDLILLHCDDGFEDGEVVLIEAAEVGFSLLVGLSLFGELVVVVGGQFFNSGPVLVVVVLEFVAEVAVLVDQSGDFCLSLLAGPFEAVVALLDLVFLLFNLVGQPFDFGLMQILEFILVFAVLSG